MRVFHNLTQGIPDFILRMMSPTRKAEDSPQIPSDLLLRMWGQKDDKARVTELDLHLKFNKSNKIEVFISCKMAQLINQGLMYPDNNEESALTVWFWKHYSHARDELKKIKQQNENFEIERRELSDKSDVKNLLAVSHEFSYDYHTVVKQMKCCNAAYENLFGHNAYPAQVGRRMIGCVEKNEDLLVTMGIGSSHIWYTILFEYNRQLTDMASVMFQAPFVDLDDSVATNWTRTFRDIIDGRCCNKSNVPDFNGLFRKYEAGYAKAATRSIGGSQPNHARGNETPPAGKSAKAEKRAAHLAKVAAWKVENADKIIRNPTPVRTEWKLKSGEKWASFKEYTKTFPHIDGSSGCAKWHIMGECSFGTGCERAQSHRDITEQGVIEMVNSWLASCCTTLANKEPKSDNKRQGGGGKRKRN